jgi:hypothetical protein
MQRCSTPIPKALNSESRSPSGVHERSRRSAVFLREAHAETAWGCNRHRRTSRSGQRRGGSLCTESREPRTFARRPSSIGSNQLSKTRPSASSARAGRGMAPWRGLQPGATSGIRVANPGDYATLNPTTFARGDAARHSAMFRRSSGKLGTTRDKLFVGACPSELGGHIVARPIH